MSAFENWKAAVESGGSDLEGLEKPVKGHPSARYPLLAETRPEAQSATEPVATPQRWRLRLDLSRSERVESWSDEELRFLLEDLDELERSPNADPRLAEFSGPTIVSGSLSASTDAAKMRYEASEWTAYSSSAHLPSAQIPGAWQRSLRGSDGTKLEEFSVRCDQDILKSVALLGSFASNLTEGQCATVLLGATVTDEPEELVGETVRALTGIFSGFGTVAVQASPDEDCQHLAWRLNILRVLRWEADLAFVQHPSCQAPFFEELRTRLLRG